MLNRSPFYLGVFDQDRAGHFCDRQEEVRRALTLLRNWQDVEVTGARRVGKTWFLRYLSCPTVQREYGMDPRRYLFVYIDCQRRLGQANESQVYSAMSERILETAHRAGVECVPCDEPGAATTFEQILRKLSLQGLRTALLLDEFEAVARNLNLGVSFFYALRALGEADDVSVAYVTASCTRLVELLSKHQFSGSTFFDNFRPVRLGLFDEQDSWRLIEESLHRAGVHFPRDLSELVIRVGGGHPFFLQMAGSHAFDVLDKGEKLTEDKSKAFLEALTAEALRHFRFYWQKLDEREQYVLAALPLLWQDLSHQGIIQRLGEKCLITKRNGRYSYFSPLFEAFVRRQKVDGLLQVGPLMVDLRRAEVLLRGEPLSLSPTNYALLTCLMRRAGEVVRNEELWQEGWSEEPHNVDQQIKSGIKSLRKALGDEADCIVNRRGIGYIFEVRGDVPTGLKEGVLGRELGSVHVIEKIGSGGMGTVYKAYQPSLDRYVAVKVLSGDTKQGGFQDRFRQEAQVLAKLCHPNILSIHEFGQEGDLAYIVMDYISGGTLADLIRRGLPLRRAIEVAVQIGDALHYAHAQGIVHRDVKPTNILVAEDGRPLLTDFGLVKLLTASEKLTRSGIGVGTAAYVAPEQASGGEVDARSDVYALGIVLYEMVTGSLPFEAENGITVVLKKLQEPPPSPRQFDPSLPIQVEQVILKAIAPRPEDRYQSASEMTKALKTLQAVVG